MTGASASPADALSLALRGVARLCRLPVTPHETSVFAVRFRDHALPHSALRMDRVRVDVGVVVLHEGSDDLDGLPWLQAALGW